MFFSQVQYQDHPRTETPKHKAGPSSSIHTHTFSSTGEMGRGLAFGGICKFFVTKPCYKQLEYIVYYVYVPDISGSGSGDYCQYRIV